MRLNQIHDDLYHKLQLLRNKIAIEAQNIYDEWDNSDGDGICDDIASMISSILSDHNIDNVDGGHDGDDHAYTIAYDDSNSYIIDIPHDIYEVGGGYNWKKIPGIQFSSQDVLIYEVHRPDYI